MPPPIAPKQVFLLNCQTCTVPKPKFFVVATVAPVTRCFLINSNPSKAQAANPDLMAALIAMRRIDHAGFLSWDSYLATTDLMREYNEQELLEALADRPDCFKGSLHPSVVASVKASLPNNRILPVVRIKEILACW